MCVYLSMHVVYTCSKKKWTACDKAAYIIEYIAPHIYSIPEAVKALLPYYCFPYNSVYNYFPSLLHTPPPLRQNTLLRQHVIVVPPSVTSDWQVVLQSHVVLLSIPCRGITVRSVSLHHRLHALHYIMDQDCCCCEF